MKQQYKIKVQKHTFLNRVWLLLSLLSFSVIANDKNKKPQIDRHIPAIQYSESYPGGDATNKNSSRRTFIEPSRTLNPQRKMDFWVGFSFFRDPWVIAPASTTARDGLGPLFNARSCIACHDNGGRSALPNESTKVPVALMLKLGKRKGDQLLGNKGDPIYGNQLQPRSINRLLNKGLAPNKPVSRDVLAAEGHFSRRCKIIKGHFNDGESYSLCQPEYKISNLAHGPLAKGTQISAQMGPGLLGLGLLEQIPKAALLSYEDIEDKNSDGISGKANQVWDRALGKVQIGRFGLKAGHSSVAHQTGAAFSHDIGITNPIYPMEECTALQIGCLKRAQQDKRHAPLDIEAKLFDKVVFFTKSIAVPKARNFGTEQFIKGRKVFYQSQCNACHKPSHVLENRSADETKNLVDKRQQIIWPYTDLLLHDMGNGLADGRAEFLASGGEWRTAPLWGLGLRQKLTNRLDLLHDGRAGGFMEAILWHGGEAEMAKQSVLGLSKQQREDLVFFLQSL